MTRFFFALLCLASFFPNQIVGQSYDGTCTLTLDSMDMDGDNILSRDPEYVSLVNTVAKNSFGAAQTFTDLPSSLQSFYNKFVSLRSSSVSLSNLNKKTFCERLHAAIAGLPKQVNSWRLVQSENHRMLQTQNETESYDFCLGKMRISDSDRNSLFDKEEYRKFALHLSDHRLPEITSSLQSAFDASFHSLAIGGAIDVYGAAPGQNASLEQSQYLSHVCNSTFMVISDVTSTANATAGAPSTLPLATPQESPNPTAKPSTSSLSLVPSSGPSSKPLTAYPSSASIGTTPATIPSVTPQESTNPTSKPSTSSPSLAPSSGPSSKPPLTAFPSSVPTTSTSSITIHSSFVIAGSVHAILDALENDHDHRGLRYSYSELVSHIVWAQNRAGRLLRSSRRGLKTSLQSHSEKLYGFVDAHCDGAVGASLCQTVYASYELVILDDDVGKEEVYATYVEATSTAIKDGRLQMIWENLNPDSDLSVTGIGEQVIPAVTDNPADGTITDKIRERQPSPTPAPTTTSSDTAAGSGTSQGLLDLSDKMMIAFGILAIAMLNCAFMYYGMVHKDKGSQSIAPTVRDLQGSEFEIFDDEDQQHVMSRSNNSTKNRSSWKRMTDSSFGSKQSRKRDGSQHAKHLDSSYGSKQSRKRDGSQHAKHLDSSHGSKQSRKREGSHHSQLFRDRSSNSGRRARAMRDTSRDHFAESSSESAADDSIESEEESVATEDYVDSEDSVGSRDVQHAEDSDIDSSDDEPDFYDDDSGDHFIKNESQTSNRYVSSSERLKRDRLTSSEHGARTTRMDKDRLSSSDHQSNRRKDLGLDDSQSSRRGKKDDEFSRSPSSDRMSSSEHTSTRTRISRLSSAGMSNKPGPIRKTKISDGLSSSEHMTARRKSNMAIRVARLQKSEHTRMRFKEKQKAKDVPLVDKISQELRARVEDIVRKIDPSQLVHVDTMLADYKGREKDLIIVLTKRLDQVQKRRTIETLVRQVEPEKISQIDKMIAEYDGDESAVIQALLLKRNMLLKVYELRASQHGRDTPK